MSIKKVQFYFIKFAHRRQRHLESITVAQRPFYHTTKKTFGKPKLTFPFVNKVLPGQVTELLIVKINQKIKECG